jgi:hypothetical protein
MGNEKSGNPNRRTLALQIEVSGCACTCAHCGAQGHPYPAMPLKDIERVLKAADRFCKAEGIAFDRELSSAYHEILTHPDALKVMQLFNEYNPAHIRTFEPLTTPGPLLAILPDWEEILNGAKELGTEVMWFALHGIGEVHDRLVKQKDAFAKIVIAIDRAKSVGLYCGGNVFFSTENLHQIPQIIEFCQSKLDAPVSYEVATYCPTPRLRAYEDFRPTLAQLAPYAARIDEAATWRRIWVDLEKYTEASYVRQALNPAQAEKVEWTRNNPNRISLICRNNLDLHTGDASISAYGPCHGNLGRGNMQETFRKAARLGPLPFEQLYFPGKHIPPVSELAAKWGDPQGQKIYSHPNPMFLRWLDVALAD